MTYYADRARLVAKILLAGRAPPAFTAANPGIDDALVADRNALGVGTHRNDASQHFMTGRAREADAPLGQSQDLATAQIVCAFPEMQIGVTDTAMRHFHDHLAPRWLRRIDLDALQWLPVLDHCPQSHVLSSLRCGSLLPSVLVFAVD